MSLRILLQKYLFSQMLQFAQIFSQVFSPLIFLALPAKSTTQSNQFSLDIRDNATLKSSYANSRGKSMNGFPELIDQ